MISVFKMFEIFALQPERLDPVFPVIPMGVPAVVAASCLMEYPNFKVGAFCAQMSPLVRKPDATVSSMTSSLK
jgi:hypothetical protein